MNFLFSFKYILSSRYRKINPKYVMTNKDIKCLSLEYIFECVFSFFFFLACPTTLLPKHYQNCCLQSPTLISLIPPACYSDTNYSHSLTHARSSRPHGRQSQPASRRSCLGRHVCPASRLPSGCSRSSG